LAANQLILRDVGRTAHDARSDKPLGSVHGASIGVQACDSANAWRNMVPACASIHCYGALDGPARPVFDLLLCYAVSEDGALHAEKFYRTVAEEFAATRKPFRWRQLVALARVTASEFGHAAPGYAESRALLKV